MYNNHLPVALQKRGISIQTQGISDHLRAIITKYVQAILVISR